MKSSIFLAIAALVTAPLMGQSSKEIADNLTLPQLAPGAKTLPIPEVPADATITLGGADFEEIIANTGKIQPVISEVPVQVYFRVTKDGQTVNSKDYEVIVRPAAPAAADANPKPTIIPAILQWSGGKGAVNLKRRAGGITIGAEKEDAALAQLLADELQKMLSVPVQVKIGAQQELSTLIRLSREVGSRDVTRGEGPLPSGLGKEGYQLIVRAQKSLGEKTSPAGTTAKAALPEGIEIIAPTSAGLYWGTRTLLQILVQQEGKVPEGMAVDFPRYAVRGCMLDVGRVPYSMSDLYRLVDLMTWFKLNDLHLGLNNNYIFLEHYASVGRDPLNAAYAAFRLESKVIGANGIPLTARDLYYTKKEFRALIDYAKERGVNIVPEINSPAHALALTRVRPELIYQGPMRRHVHRRSEMLDAAKPETLQFVSGIFDEYLQKDAGLGRAVFEGCVVHVGSDEFFGAAEDYRKYANGILTHVLQQGYTPRIWGSLSAKKGKTPVVSKGVQMNIWSKDWMLPFAAVEQGYDIINTFDTALYIVPFENYYRMDRNLKGTYEGWLPNRMGPEQLPAGHPQLLGATFAVWNDRCDIRYPGYCMLDIINSISGAADVIIGRLWGAQPRTTPYDQHRKLADALGKSPFDTEFSRTTDKPGDKCIWKKSGAELTVIEGLRDTSVAPSYHLIMEGVKLEKATPGKEQVLLSGSAGTLIGVREDGTIGFRRADSVEFAWDAKLPEGKEVKLELIGTPGKTRLFIDGKEIETLSLCGFSDNAESFRHRTQDLISTFTLPLHIVGAKQDGSSAFSGSIRSVEVRR